MGLSELESKGLEMPKYSDEELFDRWMRESRDVADLAVLVLGEKVIEGSYGEGWKKLHHFLGVFADQNPGQNSFIGPLLQVEARLVELASEEGLRNYLLGRSMAAKEKLGLEEWPEEQRKYLGSLLRARQEAEAETEGSKTQRLPEYLERWFCEKAKIYSVREDFYGGAVTGVTLRDIYDDCLVWVADTRAFQSQTSSKAMKRAGLVVPHTTGERGRGRIILNWEGFVETVAYWQEQGVLLQDKRLVWSWMDPEDRQWFEAQENWQKNAGEVEGAVDLEVILESERWNGELDPELIKDLYEAGELEAYRYLDDETVWVKQRGYAQLVAMRDGVRRSRRD